MTKREASIISLYTGFIIGEPSEIFKLAKEILKEDISIGDFSNKEVAKKIRKKVRIHFLKLVRELKD